MIIVYIEDLSVMRRLQTVLDILSYTESSYTAVQRFFRLRVSPLIKWISRNQIIWFFHCLKKVSYSR